MIEVNSTRIIQDAFLKKTNQGKPAFIPFIMGGYPSYNDSLDIALTLQEAGADILEVGFPYSDPLADGPVIQEASQVALQNGMSLSKGLSLIEDMRKAGVRIPIIAFCYYNPVLQYGLERFVQKAKEIGATGVLVPDLPFEESEEIRTICRKEQFAYISLVAPTSKQRISNIVSQADGFIYCISSLGVTGVRDQLSDQIEVFLEEVKAHTKLPLAVGFGVSKKEHIAYLMEQAEGIIIGSAIIKQISNHIEEYSNPSTKAQALDSLKRFVQELF